ncbi:hypothetical protein Scep_004284 [Stephania cephalantha]|uniref:Uncharacterized protein n=1 Tax=Stephania cephalantha TaxID=152367 RepID=A0AAP0KUR2_9MAGN
MLCNFAKDIDVSTLSHRHEFHFHVPTYIIEKKQTNTYKTPMGMTQKRRKLNI